MSLRVTLCLALSALVVPSGVDASWNSNGSGGAAAKASAMADGNTPTTSISGRNVTVSWSASSISGGGPAASSYTVKRYNASGVEQSIGSGCSGTVVALSCTEDNVLPGDWKYSVTPSYQSWQGGESSQSITRTVASPTYTLSSSSTVTGLPAALNGDLASFKTGATVTYRLDDPSSGTVLSATTTPSTIGSNGAATNSVTIPSGTANGSHTIYAIGSTGDQASIGLTVDTPEVTATTINKSTGCKSGYAKQGAGYYVYANVTGSPASVSADVSNITTGQTNASLSAGSWTVNGTTYNYRTALLTANGSLSAGAKSYTVTPAGGSSSNGSVTIDNTAPAASDIQAVNKAGGTLGRPEIGDTVTYTFSEAMDPCSLVPSWNGTGTANVVVRITQNGSNDPMTIRNSTNTTQLAFGSVNTFDSVSGNTTFGAGGTPSTMTMSGSTLTITLGTSAGSPRTNTSSVAMIWTPSTSAFDWAGNPNTANTATESGTNDRNF